MYKYEYLSNIILNNIFVTKDTHNFMAVLYQDDDLMCYSLNPKDSDCPDIVRSVQNAFLLFINTYMNNQIFVKTH